MILLTGRPRMGKTTAIQKIIHRMGADQFMGFYTEEIRDASDRTGFSCVSLDGVKQEIASIHSTSPIRIGRYGVEVGSFENFAIPIIERALHSKKIIVVDEIGFMQMCSVPFQQMIHQIFTERSHVILGTVPLDNHPQIDEIKMLDSIKIVELNELNRDEIVAEVVESMLSRK